jgi:hypothetical protein
MNQEKSAVRRRCVQLAPANELIKKPFLNEFEVSAITGRAVSTLRNDRHLRRGLPYLKVSARSIRYRTPDVMNFMEARPISFNEN